MSDLFDSGMPESTLKLHELALHTGLDIFSGPEYGGAKFIEDKAGQEDRGDQVKEVTCKSSAN
jgi:hypothetical protein